MKIQVKFSQVPRQNFDNVSVTVKFPKLLVFDNVKDFLFDMDYTGYLTLVFTNTDEVITIDHVNMFGTVD